MFEVKVTKPSEVIKKLISIDKYADTARFYLHNYSDFSLNEGEVAEETYLFTEQALKELLMDRLEINNNI